MSGSGTRAAPTTDTGGDVELSHIKSALATAREELTEKIEKGRVRDPERDRVRCETARALAYVCNIELKAYETARLEELGRQVEELKADREVSA
jgi:hypothetical protein